LGQLFFILGRRPPPFWCFLIRRRSPFSCPRTGICPPFFDVLVRLEKWVPSGNLSPAFWVPPPPRFIASAGFLRDACVVFSSLGFCFTVAEFSDDPPCIRFFFPRESPPFGTPKAQPTFGWTFSSLFSTVVFCFPDP